MRGQVTEVYKIFDSRDKQLLIPVYQRNYDWKVKQCAQLLSDLVDLIRSDRPKHFFGAVVGKPEGSWRWVVIDGQQRLTTVSLLMLALSNLIDEGVLETVRPELGRRIRRSYLFTDPESDETRFRLKPVKDDSEAYQRLFGPESEYIESSNVTANYRFFMEELPRVQCTADDLWAAITRLEVMHLDLEEHDDPQRIFESLNSTGLALSEADKVRNFVLMGLSSVEQTRVYESYWNRIEKNVDYETDTFLRWYLVTKTSKTPRIDRVYDTFKAFATDVGLAGSELLAEIREYSDHYRRLLSSSTGSAMVDSRLRRLNMVKQDVALPFLMPLLADYRAGAVTEGDLAESIRIIESYLFRRFVCGIATNSLSKIFATLHKDVRKLRTAGVSFSEVLAYSLDRRAASGRFPDDDEFRDEFATRNMYAVNPDRRRYIFECLENLDSNDTRDIAIALDSGVVTVEHIMPQSLSDTWRRELGPDAETIHQTWSNRIGNLTVTGYNSMYSNRPFSEKQRLENGFATSPYRLNQELKHTQSWGPAEMAERTRRLTDDALGYWRKPSSSFIPPKPQQPVEPLGWETSFTGRSIVAFEYEESKVTVSNWRDALVQILQLLVSQHRDRIFEFAEESEWFFSSEEHSSAGRSLWQIVPGLHVNAASSTWVKLGLLRRLFEHLGLDPEEMLFTFRPDEADERDAEAEERADDPYAVLTKFIDPFEDLAGSEALFEDTRELRAEFVTEFGPFRVADIQSSLGTAAARFAARLTPGSVLSPEQVLALISAKLIERDIVNPAALHDAIMDGSLASWLKQLQ